MKPLATTIFVASFASLATACSSNGGGGGGETTVPPTEDAGGDATTTPVVHDAGSTTPTADASNDDAGVDGSTLETACTLAPFVGYSATLSKLSANGSLSPLSGARIGFTTCVGFELTTGANGTATTQLTQGVAVTPLYESNAVISALGAEIPASGDVTTAITLFADDTTTLIPGFALDGGEAAIVEVVLAVDAAATAPCNTTTGVTLSVTGHPEASVSYMGASWPTDATVASTTASTDGTRAFIGGIVGATKVQITGVSSGCSVKLVTASQTGNFTLLPGAITVGTATITN